MTDSNPAGEQAGSHEFSVTHIRRAPGPGGSWSSVATSALHALDAIGWIKRQHEQAEDDGLRSVQTVAETSAAAGVDVPTDAPAADLTIAPSAAVADEPATS